MYRENLLYLCKRNKFRLDFKVPFSFYIFVDSTKSCNHLFSIKRKELCYKRTSEEICLKNNLHIEYLVRNSVIKILLFTQVISANKKKVSHVLEINQS